MQDKPVQTGKNPSPICAALHHGRFGFNGRIPPRFMMPHSTENAGKCLAGHGLLGRFTALHAGKLSYKSRG
jgi:hypothetical protein